MANINITGISGSSPPYTIKVYKVGLIGLPIFTDTTNTTGYTGTFTHEEGSSYYAVVEKSGCNTYLGNPFELSCQLCDVTAAPTGVFTVQEVFNYTNNTANPVTVDVAFYAVNIPDRLIIKKNGVVVKDTGCIGLTPAACQGSANCQYSNAVGYYITLAPTDNLVVLIDGKCSNNQNTCWGARVRCNSGLTPSNISVSNQNCTASTTVSSFQNLDSEPPVGCNVQINYLTQECVDSDTVNIFVAASSSLGEAIEYGIVVGTNPSGTPPTNWYSSIGQFSFLNIDKNGQNQFGIWARNLNNNSCFTVGDYSFINC